MARAHQFGHPRQIVEAAQETQVVARPAGVLAGDQVRDGLERTLAVAVARGHMAGHAHVQLLGPERRGHVDPVGGGGQAQRVLEEARRTERAREQHRGMRGREAPGQVRRGNHVAHAERGQRRLGAGRARLRQRGVEQRVLAVQLGQALEVQRLEMEGQHRIVLRQRHLGQRLGDRRRGLLQRGQHARRRRLIGLVRLGLLAVEGLPGAVQPVQRLLQRLGRGLARAGQRGLRQLGGVHATRAVDQVMRLVRQHCDLPLTGLRQRVQHGRGVVVIVVVTHHHVAPARQFLRQVIGADVVRRRDLAQRGGVHAAVRQRAGAGLRQAVVEASRQRAGLAMARLVRMLAELVARLQLQHPQAGRGRLRVQRVQRLQRQRAARPLGGQEEQLVQAGLGRGLEQRKQGAQRFADAGRRLRQQAAAIARLAVGGHRQLALAAAEFVRKAQCRQRRVARAPVRLLLPRPGQVALALRVEERLQLGRRMRLDQHGFLFGGDVEIHQRHRQAGQAARLAQQMAVDLGLRPVRGAVVLAHAVQASTIGLDLFQALGGGVVAVGAAAHQQFAVFAGQGNLGFIAGAAPARHHAVPGHAFLAGRRGREAQVQVAGTRGELAQRAHGGHAAHRPSPCEAGAASMSCQRTWQTLTGMPCDRQ